MDLGIRGRRAIVNGGSAGLGFGSALALAREGVELFVSARGEARLVEACTRIAREAGVPVTPIVADHSTEEGRARILGACPDPDILVGTCSPPPYTHDFRAIPSEDWRQAVETGFFSPIAMTEAVIGPMTQRGWGRIVHIAASAAKFPHELRLLSGAPRAALVNHAVAVSKAVAAYGVTINVMMPTFHLTPGIRAIYEPQARAQGITYEQKIAETVKALDIPAGRFGDAEDFGGLVAMICGRQSNYMTGQSIVVDGGVARILF